MRECIFYLYVFSDEPDAEKECERCLREALKIDPNNIDSLQ